MAEADGDPEDFAEANSSKHKGKKAESAEAPAEANEALSGEKANPFSMPLALIYTLNEAHLCRCPKCEPEASDHMVEEAIEMFRQEQVKIIEDNTRAEMIAAYKKQFCDGAQKQAKKEANDKAKAAEGQAFLARVKNEIREELRAEVEANHLPTPTTKHGGLSMAFPVEQRGRSSFELRENCQEANHVIAYISKNILHQNQS